MTIGYLTVFLRILQRHAIFAGNQLVKTGQESTSKMMKIREKNSNILFLVPANKFSSYLILTLIHTPVI